MGKTFQTSLQPCSYRHAGAALGEVDHSRVELVFEEVSVCHHSPSQCQTGGRHQGCSHHFGLSYRYCSGETDEGRKEEEGCCKWKLTDVAEQHANKGSLSDISLLCSFYSDSYSIHMFYYLQIYIEKVWSQCLGSLSVIHNEKPALL